MACLKECKAHSRRNGSTAVSPLTPASYLLMLLKVAAEAIRTRTKLLDREFDLFLDGVEICRHRPHPQQRSGVRGFATSRSLSVL